MASMRKHIERLYLNDIVILDERLQIAGKSCGVAGDVDNFPRLDFGECCEEFPVGTGSRGVHKNNVEKSAVFGALTKKIARIALVKGSLFGNPVFRAIFHCVPHGSRVVLNPLNRIHKIRCDNPDCADTAVRVENVVGLFQASRFYRVIVQLFRLNRVYLIK